MKSLLYQLKGQQLISIQFLWNYVTLEFERHYVHMYNAPFFSVAEQIAKFDSSEFCVLLRQHLALQVSKVELFANEYIIVFETSASLHLPLSGHEPGAEAYVISDRETGALEVIEQE